MKTCHMCKAGLPASSYYKNISKPDGLSSSCRECHRAWRRDHYQTHREQTEDTKAAWKSRNPDKYRAYARKASAAAYRKNRHLGIYHVYDKVHAAVRGGLLKPEPCRICGKLDVVAHHQDYTKPLDVLWYCNKHHRRLHQLIGSRLNTALQPGDAT